MRSCGSRDASGVYDDLRIFRTARASRVLAGSGVFRVQHAFDADARDHDFLARPGGAYGAVGAADASTPAYGAVGAVDVSTAPCQTDEEDEARATRFYKLEREADAFFERSEPSAAADCFVSHAWCDSPALKHLALLCYANLHHAIAASFAAVAAVVLSLLASHGWDLTDLGGTPWLPIVFSSVPLAAFYSTFFFGHVVAEACWRPRRWWVDKLCIHQRRTFLKLAGIRALPLFVRQSARLCVLHSESSFSRLWCCFEVATFLAEHSADHVDVVPLWLAPWILSVVAIDMLSSMLVIVMNNASTSTEGAAVLCLLIACIAYVPMCVPIVMAYRARSRAQEMMLEQLDSFSLRDTECSVEADRDFVEQHISSIFGGRAPLETFEAAVRTDVRRLLVERGGVDHRTPFLLAALPFLPLSWIAAADVLGCDNRPCGEAAAAYGVDSARLYILAQTLCWVSNLMLACSVYPAIFFLLRRTERIRSPSLRLAASGGAVAFAYAAWGLTVGVSISIVFACLSTPRTLTVTTLVSLFAALAAWTVYLFR